ncbi:tRNA-dihydrouridine synthase family protein [Bacteroides helcogenes]|uniref:tRNA-dihydrouridine synthase n=1 Tax=Bacteroides helcogenes (strain ATCC 35417 / DSM 20613 / JCM 6297 / CCUG 15421 / P 36-108) TaxID=693979 RepID=E6SWK9_BACT6|nr:tRNA-dihydrouridine synthase family protein [Bacteroides helcogenes]ADV42607.1 tRNA-U20a,U20b-dihydrouridine synthase [Bacteroides helcogenes P 36-108]MDY5237631.1 tRNA-dihydrouridine synthase family protein [Bacteroides helcogenes]
MRIFAAMNEKLLPIHFAPLQGYTDAVYRRAHVRIFGGIETYYSPFVRIEHGEIRRKDIRDILPENNPDLHLIPQLIASEADKAERITALFTEKGYQEADINLGCPFPMLAKRHNGAGMLPYPEEVKALLTDTVKKHPNISFSVKLRLGWDNPEECLALLPIFNELPLSHIILHPRLGRQQYKGEIDLKGFEAFYNGCSKPLLYNGDLNTPEDIHSIARRFPQLAGIVIGRGLLASPALALEYLQGKPLSSDEMARKVSRLHAEVFNSYKEQLQGGDIQLLMKMKSFWEYLLPGADKKARKTIHKTSKLANYQAAVSNLLGSYQ